MHSRSYNIPALDGIRGLAIILVMLHHFEGVLPFCNAAVGIIKALFYCGWMGVDLFFALSGFLITGILLDTRNAANYFRAFYARRVLRIFPLYYSVLILILGGAALLNPRPRVVPLVADQKLYLLYVMNWLTLWKGHWGANILGHFWSLAVEEQFYLIWPLCVWLIVPKHLAKFAVGASVIALLVRIYWVAHSGPSQAVVMATVTRMDSLLCGALGAILLRETPVVKIARQKLPLVVFMTIAAFMVGLSWQVLHGADILLFVETLGFSLLAMSFSALVLYVAATDGASISVQRFFRHRVLTDFGKYSYGIYVYHVPVLLLCDFLIYRRLSKAIIGNLPFGIAYFVFLSAVSFFIAKISYDYFESHFLGLKRHFEPRTPQTLLIPVCAEAHHVGKT